MENQQNVLLSKDYLEFLNFLEKKMVLDLGQLCDLLCSDQYRMEFIAISPTLRMFNASIFSDLKNPDIRLFQHMIFDTCEEDFTKPVYIEVYLEKVTLIDEVFQLFPISMANFEIYPIDKMALFLIFYTNAWIVICDKKYSSQSAKVWSEVCFQNHFDYETLLNKMHVYLFYVKHKKLNPLHKSFNSELYIFKIYHRNSYLEIPIEKMPQVRKLTPNIIQTKYEFHNVLKRQTNICKFIVEKNEQRFQISNETCVKINKFCKYFYHENMYIRFIRVMRNTKSQQKFFLEYFPEDVSNFSKIESALNTLVDYIYEQYINMYVNKTSNECDFYCKFVPNELEILYEFHIFHLKTKLQIFKSDVKNILLLTFPEKQMLNLLEQFI